MTERLEYKAQDVSQYLSKLMHENQLAKLLFTGRIFLDEEVLTQEMPNQEMSLAEIVRFLYEKGMVPELSGKGKIIISSLIMLEKVPRLSRSKFPKETREKLMGLASMFIEVNGEVKEGKRKVVIIDDKGRVVEK